MLKLSYARFFLTVKKENCSLLRYGWNAVILECKIRMGIKKLIKEVKHAKVDNPWGTG